MLLGEMLSRQKISLANELVERLAWLADELLRWNQRRNLTSITTRDEVYEKHLVDSLTILDVARTAPRLLDLGSGAGFPALPLKIACPTLDVVSIEAVAKKVAFQRHVARTLGLKGFTAIHGRAEDVAQEPCYQGAFAIVVARALGDLPLLVKLAAPFLAPTGCLLAMKGPEADNELARCGEMLSAERWQVSSQRLELPLSGAVRCLLKVQRKTT